ncbi:MAG: M14-type cytosolic carboxypeptidase [Gammaproteobacteria bacterium]
MHFKPVCLSLLLAVLAPAALSQTTISRDFESAGFADITVHDDQHVRIAVRDDNFNAALPASWRSWWYVQAHYDLEAGQHLQLDIANRGWQYFYTPFYSYDQKLWRRIDENNVSQTADCDTGIEGCVLSFNHPAKYDHVYFATFMPYPTSALDNFVKRISTDASVSIETLGFSQHYQLPIYHITITDPNSTKQKSRVWIHGRSHPAETPSSFVLEGFINFLISGHPVARSLRNHLIFHIVPMHNVDGVFEGNYRSNPDSIDFESSWYFDKNNPAVLTAKAPQETQMINAVMRRLLDDDIPVKMALNLHASNSEPDTAIFAFPHFGDNRKDYSRSERDLWEHQLTFIDYLTRLYDNRIELPPEEGGRGFLNSFFPETWWWNNKQNDVMAMTIEMTYGKAGFDHWITDVEQRHFGEALAKSIAVYFALEDAPLLPPALEDRVRRDSIIYQPGFEAFK